MNYILRKYILIIICFLFSWLALIPLAISFVIPIICENLSHNSPYTIKIEKPRVYTGILPVLTIKANSVNFTSEISDNSLILQNPKIKIRLLPLISGRIHINEIGATSFESDIILDNTPNKNIFSMFKNTKFKCNTVYIDNFKLTFRKADEKENAVYSGKELKFHINDRYLKFNLDSNLKTGEKESVINLKLLLPKNNNGNNSIEVEISNMDLSLFAPYLKDYLPKDVENLNGIIDLSADNSHLTTVLRNMELKCKDSSNSVIFPAILNIKSNFNLTKKLITISNAEIDSDGINTVISGKFSNYMDKTRTALDLNIRINKLKAEQFINMLPSFKTEDFDIYKLKKYKFYGDVIGNISIKGDTIEPAVYGNVYINNGVLTKPIPNAKGATVKLAFKGKYLNYDVTVPADMYEKVWVKGGVELYNVKYSDMRVWSTKNVNLAIAEEKVVPIHEILNFVIGPVPIMDIKGLGSIDITVKGNRKKPHVWGDLTFRDVTTHFNEIPNLVLEKANTILTFNDENAVFNLLEGNINGTPVNIDGTCNLNGKFDFDVKAQKQNLAYLYRALKTSTMIDELKGMVPEFDSMEGLADLNLKVYGCIKDILDVKFNENLYVKGAINLIKDKFEYQGIRIYNTDGKLKFDNTNANIDVSSFIGKSQVKLAAELKNNIVDAVLSAPILNLKDITSISEKLPRDITNIPVSVSAKYTGSIDKIEYDKADFTAKILGTPKYNKLQLSEGLITLKNGNLAIQNLYGHFNETGSYFNLNMKVNNITSKPVFNGRVQLKDFELSLISILNDISLLPENIRKTVRCFRFENGKINTDTYVHNNSVKGSANIGGISFTYTPIPKTPENGKTKNFSSQMLKENTPIPFKVVNGSIYINKNNLGLNKINLMAEYMPLLIDGNIADVFTEPVFNVYINSKPKQEFIDKYINNNRIYPIKVKGDIVYTAKIKGTKNDINIESEANLAKEAAIYYLGATIGDVENSIVLNLNMNLIKQNIAKIREFSYDKIIDSQGKRKTRLNMLKVAGGIDVHKDDLVFHDLKIKTTNPTDARIFNIIFRKPNIKQGQFTSDLRFNGKLSNPKVLGTFHIAETEIPFFDTTMKNLSFIFRDKTIQLSSTGEILGNDMRLKGVLKNKLTVPYYIENAEFYTKVLDLNHIIEKQKTAQVEETNIFESFAGFDFKNTIIKNIKLTADEIKLRNLVAENVEASASLSESKVFNVNKFKFYIANGFLNGNFTYNLINNKTGLNLNAENINANDITIAIFNLDNQIYGNLTGALKLSCNGSDFNECMQTLNGNTNFSVTDGRMPKLGSLEYLLKAGNLVKGGITGISVNGVIDLLTPYKTGSFSDIYGNIKFSNGIADDIEISTKGKDLSLFMYGKYNLATSEAEMEVLGLLSKKISTMLGPIGNVSINTLFNVVPGIDLSKDSKLLDNINKIPGIELNEKAFRKFIAEIKGNINGDNYVKSFQWIN